MIRNNVAKELDLYADSKYMQFIELIVIHPKLRAKENMKDFRKKSQEIIMETTPSDSACQRTPSLL